MTQKDHFTANIVNHYELSLEEVVLTITVYNFWQVAKPPNLLPRGLRCPLRLSPPLFYFFFLHFLRCQSNILLGSLRLFGSARRPSTNETTFSLQPWMHSGSCLESAYPFYSPGQFWTDIWSHFLHKGRPEDKWGPWLKVSTEWGEALVFLSKLLQSKWIWGLGSIPEPFFLSLSLAFFFSHSSVNQQYKNVWKCGSCCLPLVLGVEL